MQVRELITKIGFKVDDKGLKRAEAGIASLKTAALSLGAAIIGVGGSLFALAKSAANAGDNALKAAQKTGLSVEAYQKLAYAAELADVSTEQLGVGMAQLSKKMLDASEGGEENAKLFKALGINIKDASGQLLEGDQVLMQLSDTFAKMPDGPRKTALAMDVFGKSGMQLIPLLNGGGESIRKLGKQLENFNGVIGNKTARSSERMNDNLTSIFGPKGIVASAKNTIGATLIPIIEDVTGSFVEWAEANRELIKTKLEEWAKMLASALIFIVKKGIVLVKWAISMEERFGAITILLKVAAAAFLAFVAAKIITGLYSLVSAIWAVTTALLAMDTAAIVPILIVAAIALIGAAVYAIYDDVKAFLEGRPNMFGPIYQWFINVYHKLVSAWNTLKEFWENFWVHFVVDIIPIIQKMTDVLMFPYRMILGAIKKVIEAHNYMVNKLAETTGIDFLKKGTVDPDQFASMFGLDAPEKGLDNIFKALEDFGNRKAAEATFKRGGADGPVNPLGYSLPGTAALAPPSAQGSVSKKQDNKFNLNQSVTINATTSGDPAQLGDFVKNIINSETGKQLRNSLKALQGLQ